MFETLYYDSSTKFIFILKLIGKSITPGNNELEENNRSRSSRLRVAEKIRIK